MKSSLTNVWHEVEKLLIDNISLVPVREKDEVIDGNTYVAKSAYGKWKRYQSEIVSKEQLWHDLEKWNTSAVAIVCGKVSGNLEFIDVDVKYKPGIDATLFSDLDRLYPTLYARLRIHRTPSGGYHIPYRISDHEVPGNEKVAGRYATPQELAQKKEKVKNFIETRGEGGYAVAPPSLGYTIHQDQPIPTLTWEERCSIITLCQSYTELIPIEKVYKPTKYESNYYDENPFEHFNNSEAAETVLTDNGWKFKGKSNLFIWFTRPGKDNGVSASFNRHKRVYYIFTSSTEFDASRGYQPATCLATLRFNGDKKKTYQYLVAEGYGRVKHKVEQDAVRKKALSGGPLPANFSPDAHQLLNNTLTIQSEKYPYGTFWIEDEDSMKINRERLYVVAERLGFRLHTGSQIVQITGFTVKKVTFRYFTDSMKAYIKEEDPDYYETIANAFEAFIQRAGQFTSTRLPLLDTSMFLVSTKTMSFKFYLNGYVTITSQSITIHPYDELQGRLVWEESIHSRSLTLEPAHQGQYYQFLDHAIGVSANSNHLLKCIGYLAHDFKDGSTGYIIVLTEQCPDPKLGGGSGKNIFSNLLKYTTSFKNIPGSQVQYNEKFLQSWNFERVFSLSDVPKKFDFGFLKELSTGTGIIKKLYQDETTVTSTMMPKIIVSTNYSYEVTDGGLKRRIIPIEFTNFFTKCGGVDAYFGTMFPDGEPETVYLWSEVEWSGFDNLILHSIQLYLADSGKLSPPLLTESGWMKQFEQTHWQLTREFITEHWDEWVRAGFVSNESFKLSYDRFCVENNVGKQFILSSQKINRALEDWCGQHGVMFNKDAQHKTAHLNIRGREFRVIEGQAGDQPPK